MARKVEIKGNHIYFDGFDVGPWVTSYSVDGEMLVLYMRVEIEETEDEAQQPKKKPGRKVKDGNR